MGLSIITPHFNNSEGLQNIYGILKKQNNNLWQWIIVDDCSPEDCVEVVKSFFKKCNDSRVTLIINKNKTNASVCRNHGIEHTVYEQLVFLDSDDTISLDFVSNRAIDVSDFIVFKNKIVVDEKGNQIVFQAPNHKYLNHFLSANFIWQTTAIVWDKSFLLRIGAFNPKLKRLQDVELSIRALNSSKNYHVLNNEVDFYYHVSNIRSRQNFVKPVCESVNYFITEILDTYQLSNYQKSLIKSYYFMCTKYLERSEDRANVKHIQTSLMLFYKKKYLNVFDYIVGSCLLKLYKFRLLHSTNFLKINRYFFKTQLTINEEKN